MATLIHSTMPVSEDLQAEAAVDLRESASMGAGLQVGWLLLPVYLGNKSPHARSIKVHASVNSRAIPITFR